MVRPTKKAQRQKSRIDQLKISYELCFESNGNLVETFIHVPCPGLGDRIKQALREKKKVGITQESILESADVSRQYLNQIYKGNLCCVNGDKITALESALGVEFGYRDRLDFEEIIESLTDQIVDLCGIEDEEI